MEQSDPLIGTTVGNYEVIDLLGEGAMGQVYLGEHPQIGRKVAIKVLIGSLSANPEMADRFLSEAKAVNKISHPNIIQVFDFGKLPDGRLYLTMEYLEGEDLTVFMAEKGKMSLSLVAAILAQISSALDAAHSVGIVHRDLKPDNIFVVQRPDGTQSVKILDFGVAKLLEPDLGAKHKTATGLIMGTPSYMCPEQAAGDVKAIAPQSDIYALGIIIYQMLSERLPIEADIVPKVLVKHIAEPPTPIYEYLPDFPPFIWQVIEKTLEKEPKDRYQTAGEFYQAFLKSMDDVSGLEVDKSFVSSVSTLNPALTNTLNITSAKSGTQVEGESFSVNSKSKLPLIAIILVVAVVLGVGIYFLTRPKNSDDMDYKDSSSKVASNNNKTPSADMKVVVPPMTVDATKISMTPPVVKEITFNVTTWNKKKIKVKIIYEDKKTEIKKTPFDLKFKKKSTITLIPLSRYYLKQEKIIVDSDKKVVLGSRRKNHIRIMRTVHEMKPIIMKPIVIMKPMKPKPMKHRPMKSMLGEGTIKVMW